MGQSPPGSSVHGVFQAIIWHVHVHPSVETDDLTCPRLCCLHLHGLNPFVSLELTPPAAPDTPQAWSIRVCFPPQVLFSDSHTGVSQRWMSDPLSATRKEVFFFLGIANMTV